MSQPRSRSAFQNRKTSSEIERRLVHSQFRRRPSASCATIASSDGSVVIVEEQYEIQEISRSKHTVRVQHTIVHCDSLVLQIVLAFGNYMNSSKRGPVYGFKLASLEIVSARNGRQPMLEVCPPFMTS